VGGLWAIYINMWIQFIMFTAYVGSFYVYILIAEIDIL
jgi:hypothetical protein